MKKSLTIVGIIILTVILAVLSVVTALRIKEMGTRPIAPSAPESKPKAVDVGPPDDLTPAAVCLKSLSVTEEITGTPTPTPEVPSCQSLEGYEKGSSPHSLANLSVGDTVMFDNQVTMPEGLVGAGFRIAISKASGEDLTSFPCSGTACGSFVIPANAGDSFKARTVLFPVVAPGSEPPLSTLETVDDCEITFQLRGVPSSTPTPTPTGAPGSMCEYLQADKTSGSAPLAVNFEGKGFDPTRVKGFRFTFGDGDKKEVFGSFSSDHIEKISHTYSGTNTYKAKLEILDDGDHWKTRPECEVTIKTTGEGPTPTEVSQATPTEPTLPVAGLKIPTLAGILAGFLLISLGAALVF